MDATLPAPNAHADDLQVALVNEGRLRLAVDVKDATVFATSRIGGRVQTHAAAAVDLDAGTVVTSVERDGTGAWLTLDDGEEVFVAYLGDTDLVTEAEWSVFEREERALDRARELLGAYPKDWFERPLKTLAINLAEAFIAAQLDAEVAS